MEKTPAVAIFTLALLTAPALATGISGEPGDSEHDRETFLVMSNPQETWLPSGVFTPGGSQLGTSDMEIGEAVAADGGTAVVGAPGFPALFVYERSIRGWALTTRLSAGDPIGRVVDIDADRIAAGSPQAEAVHVFHRENDEWAHEEEVGPVAEDTGSDFGLSLPLEGDRLLVGARDEGVYTFARSGSGWTQVDRMAAPAGSENYGWHLDLDSTGDFLAVSALDRQDGQVYVYEPDAYSWRWQATLSTTGFSGSFGRTVAVDEGKLAIAAPDAFPVPLVHTYEQRQGSWSKTAELTPTDASPETTPGRFGASLDLAEGFLLIGAPGDDVRDRKSVV